MSDTTPVPLKQLSRAGVSIWLDDLSRERLTSGNLADLVRSGAVVGVTTNPAIFHTSLSHGAAYESQLHELSLMGASVDEAVRSLTAFDVRWACDVLREVYDRTDGVDGRVSIEVDPRVAHNAEATVAEAKSLWWLVDRPNALIKIPATRAGLSAITSTLAQGISVNVTLIFSLDRYREVTEAFLEGLERAQANGHDLSQIMSVASFFVSRVDTEIDARLEKLERSDLAGRAAIANARLAYAAFEEVLSSDRWKRLAEAGARPQRPLWASTGVKNPTYDDTRYVVDLVASATVNTMPEATLDAVADHGLVTGNTIAGTYEDATRLFEELAEAGIDYDDVVAGLETAGVRQFEDAWNDLLAQLQCQLDSERQDDGPAS
ncbi:transaldolase [Nocardioides sp. AN3]